MNDEFEVDAGGPPGSDIDEEDFELDIGDAEADNEEQDGDDNDG